MGNWERWIEDAYYREPEVSDYEEPWVDIANDEDYDRMVESELFEW